MDASGSAQFIASEPLSYGALDASVTTSSMYLNGQSKLLSESPMSMNFRKHVNRWKKALKRLKNTARCRHHGGRSQGKFADLR